jgi:crotonobetainyl-CoA:carnitine CoA-transferase CaiB-like acyl-CoA transferase
VAHPLTDALKLVASPIKMSVTPPTVRRAPPLLGEHTQEVLAPLDDAPLNTHRSP